MTTYGNVADVGPDATAVSIANSINSGDAFAVVSAGTSNTITYAAAAAFHKALGFLFTKGGTAASILGFQDTAGSTSFAARTYLNMTGLPSNDATQLGIQMRSTADATMGRAQISSTGKLIMYSSAGVLATGSTTLSTGTWYRLEYQATLLGGSTTVTRCQIYAGDSGTAIDSLTSAAHTTSGTCDRVRFGNMSTGTQATFSMDDMAVNFGTGTAMGIGVSGTAGSNQSSIEPWSTVTLAGTYTGTWSQTAGSPSVTLLGSGNTRTFEAPGTIAGTTLTFGFGGDSLTVAVMAATDRMVVGGVEVPLKIMQVYS